ncbi:MAG: LacI family DNA-binding transcriptional regulator [Anaerolineae bacterium]|nr:LacI family DNA-binding transcriptional regulator [Anaerolineae bacterium]
MVEKATIRDIARLAGVSVGTASHALNNKAGVAEATRARVLEVARNLGYQPPSTTSTSIGVLMKRDRYAHFAIDPFYSYVFAGAERECQRQKINLMYASVEAESLDTSWPPFMFDNQLMGLLIVGPFPEESIRQIQEKWGHAAVLVDAYAPQLAYDSVLAESQKGAYQAISYLIEQGHQHIGLVGSHPAGYASVLERREGYQRALAAHGIADVYIEDSPLIREAVYEATRRLLERAPQVTALFACNDNVAIGAMNAATDMGRSLPDDLSIIGFDDIDLAKEVNPALTTVRVDKMAMGELAVQHLLDRLEHPVRPTLVTLLRTELVVRASVCPPGQST